MDKIRLAQALVPIVDELDEINEKKGNELQQEANELDSIIEELMAEANAEIKMRKLSQSSQLPQPLPGQSKEEWFNTLNNDQKAQIHRMYPQFWGSVGGAEAQTAFNAMQGGTAQRGVPQDYNQIDAQIIEARNRLAQLMQIKQQMLQGKEGYSTEQAGAYKEQMNPILQQQKQQFTGL